MTVASGTPASLNRISSSSMRCSGGLIEGGLGGPASSGHRYVLRTDGFVSVNARHEGGEMITHPFEYDGSELVLNYSTAATGSIRVEIQDGDGAPVAGFGIGDCREIVGDAIEQTVSWLSGSDVSRLAGQPVRLRFVMRDGDLYSVRFR